MSGVLESRSPGLWRLSTLANPSTFMRLSGKILPWLSALTAVVLAAGLVMAFMAPPDYQQGET
ncbi:MAG: heme transporter HemC, partial [Rhodomicrobium sp.]